MKVKLITGKPWPRFHTTTLTVQVRILKERNTLVPRQAACRTKPPHSMPQCISEHGQFWRLQMASACLMHRTTWAIGCWSIKVNTGWDQRRISQISCEHAAPRINIFAFFISRQITSQCGAAFPGCLIRCTASLYASVFSTWYVKVNLQIRVKGALHVAK